MNQLFFFSMGMSELKLDGEFVEHHIKDYLNFEYAYYGKNVDF